MLYDIITIAYDVFCSHLHRHFTLVIPNFSPQILSLNFLHLVDQDTRTMRVNSAESSLSLVLKYLVDSL